MANEQKDISEGGWALIQGIGQQFRQARIEMGLPQKRAAELIGSRQARVSGIEIGRHDVMLSTIERYASAYGYDVEITLVPRVEEDEFDKALREALEDVA